MSETTHGAASPTLGSHGKRRRGYRRASDRAHEALVEAAKAIDATIARGGGYLLDDSHERVVALRAALRAAEGDA